MKLLEYDKTERTLDQLHEFPPDVEVPDDISGLGPPTTLIPTAGRFGWMRWLAAIVVLGAAGMLAAQFLSSSDTEQVPAEDYMATYGTDNPVIVQEGAVAGTVEIVGTPNFMTTYGTDNPVFVGEAQYMELYGTDNPVFVTETPYMELYGTDNPVFVGEAQFMELYGTDNPVFVPGTVPTYTVDTGEYMELYGTDNPVFVGPTLIEAP